MTSSSLPSVGEKKSNEHKNSVRKEMIEKYSVPKKRGNGRPKRSEELHDEA
jgi:hypothetical protein